ncbi:hypothetical protein [Metallosphaera hakonensis]|nr:hypothetical protein [Metallosphaera hakonensis]
MALQTKRRENELTDGKLTLYLLIAILAYAVADTLGYFQIL